MSKDFMNNKNENSVKREYSDQEIKKILSEDIETPEYVNQRIKDTYECLGIHHNKKSTSKYHTWKIAVAAIAVTAGLSVVGFAANKYMAVLKSEKGDSIQYTFQVDRTKEAHAISVEPTYMPEGYECGAENTANYGKWHNDKTGGGISIIPMNASELDYIERMGQTEEFMNYKRSQQQKVMNLGDQQVDVYVSEDFYIDSDDTVKNIYLYDENEGYAIQIWSRSDLPYEEILKVAEGLKVTVLDEVVPYATEEEIKEAKAEQEQWEKESAGLKKIAAENIYEIGDEITNPMLEDKALKNEVEDIRFVVNSVEVADSISLDEYPKENFIDYENEMTPWMNEDGTLKSHDRGVLNENGEIEGIEKVNSKYVIVRMKAKNCGNTQSEWNKEDGVPVAPDLTTLASMEDGTIVKADDSYVSVNENYSLQWMSSDGSSFPVYFDKMCYTDGNQRLKHALWHPLAAGEELDYTLIYVVDEDQVEQMYLWFFSGTGGVDSQGNTIASPYVRIAG